MDILTTLQTLNACHGPAGDERGVAAAIRGFCAPFADEISSDTMGNLIVRKKGSGTKVMFAAHMDSIGYIITHIEKEGFLRFGKLGGLYPYSILHTPVRFGNGVRGLVSRDEKGELSKLTLDDLFIDIGAKDEEDAKKRVTIGDTAVFDGQAFQTGGRIVSPYMDNRISCVVLLMALEKLGRSNHDLYFVFTVQEELGLRGAKTAAYSIDPDYAVAVDVTTSDDVPGTKHEGSAVLGGGAAIKVMDSSVICHPQMVRKLSVLAERAGIKVQRDVIKAGGTDAGSIHQSRAGVLTGGVSVPCRYVHSTVEMVDISDVEACASLVAAFAQSEL
ncbi:putative aminopeptidase YsdC [bioreactor metagenome]|uniref:Putative aminopeptidase YsdC n=1 Tax=bioreactor metagenome TaxID=1076179 RepID=A0A645CMQ4_9ZZZZ